MTAQNLVSVIMVTRHTGPALDRAIESVLAQKGAVELVLVNNGNPPEVEAALTARFKDAPHVRLMTGHGDVGFARGCNLGARVASGDHLLFLSPFCRLPDGIIAALGENEEAFKKPFVLGVRLVDGQGTEIACSRRPILTPEGLIVSVLRLAKHFPKLHLDLHKKALPSHTVRMPAISRHFMVMLKADFIAMGGFDPAYLYHSEDADFLLRFKERGGHIYFRPDLTVPCLLGGAASLADDKQKMKDSIRYIHDHYGASYFHPFLWLIYAGYGLSYLAKRGQARLATYQAQKKR
ncbi:MAG: glycosyltransferase [Alphaproteobacteria bacterium]|nr:glycosyltransferase [Alphaproteobacteria bacterium]